MRTRLLLAGALLASFLLGLATVHPVALAMEAFKITTCKGLSPCIGAENSAAGNALYGKSVKGVAIKGFSIGQSYKAVAIFGKSKYASGVSGQTLASGGDAGVVGTDITTSFLNYGVEGQSQNGTGVAALSSAGNALIATTTTSNPNQAGVAIVATNGANMIVGTGPGSLTFKVDGHGNIDTPGKLFSGGSCASGCMRNTRERSYGITAATPTIEDVGEAQLAFGVASVRLDPAFANAIDKNQGYLVLLTPEGDTRGLYVAQRGPGGFVVRETQSGRSNVAFAYRIVAHPYGEHEPRLPFVRMEAAPATVHPIPVSE